MPRRSPVPGITDGADRALIAIAGSIRVQILRHLLQHGASTRKSLAEATGKKTTPVYMEIQKLEELGYVTIDKSEQPPKIVANREAVQQDLTELQTWLLR